MRNVEPFGTFHAACWEDRPLADRMLAADGTLLNARNELGETVLHDSAVENNPEVVGYLLSKGAAADPTNEFGNTPLQECAALLDGGMDNVEVIKLLLAAGANPHHCSDTNLCAWHLAQQSKCAPLRNLFQNIPAPDNSEDHEICELFGMMESEDD